jgi:uncharacterized protein YdhG (YjbR/CyaY superfamily)
MGNEVDAYLAAQPEPQRGTLTAMRDLVGGLVPRAEEGIAYGAPAWRVDGTAIAGITGSARHCSYLPHSGEVVALLGDALAGYDVAKGTVRFAVDTPLPRPLVRLLLTTRIGLESTTVDSRGFARDFYADGGLKAKGKRKDGELHGAWQWWRKDGSLLRSGSFDRGRQVGEWTTYDRASQPVKVTDFGR